MIANKRKQPRTTKLHGHPIQKFGAKKMKLIYTISSKKLIYKGFHEIFPLYDGKHIRCENSTIICQKKRTKKFVSGSKTAVT